MSMSPRSRETVRKSVLVIDDHDAAADALVELLRALGWNAESAYSAEDAQVSIVRTRPDIILLDIGMPDMDGYELLSLLRKEMGVLVPIIALTGYGLPEDQEKARVAGFSAHLTKPVGMKELQETLLGLVLS